MYTRANQYPLYLGIYNKTKLLAIDSFFGMLLYTYIALGAVAVILTHLETVSYKIVTIFLFLVLLSNLFAKRMIDLITRYAPTRYARKL